MCSQQCFNIQEGVHPNRKLEEDNSSGVTDRESSVVWEVFNLDSERTLIQTEFTTYTQEHQQEVQAYLSNKMSLFKLACNSSECSFDTLLTHVIEGLLNHPVWRQVRRPRSAQLSLRQQLQSEMPITEVILKVPRLHDGLVTISSVRKTMGEISTDDLSAPVPMVIDVMQGGDQHCYRCHRSGHQRADCIAKKMNDGKEIIDKPMGRRSTTPKGRETDLKKKKRCFNCNKSNHLAKE